MAYKDPEQGRALARKSFRRRTEDRRAQGLCPRCGELPPEPGRTVCGPCAEKRNATSRARDAKLREAGKPRRDPAKARTYGRERTRRQTAERLSRGICTRCGKLPPAPKRKMCEPCIEKRRAAERERYAVRRANGLCARCGRQTTDGGSRCAPCAVLQAKRGSPERKNASSRRRYELRRAAGRCTDCGQSSQGASRCEPFAKRSFERSEHVRGIPLWDPQYTVIELTSGDNLGTYDSEADVALCLAFAKLSWDQVEIVVDVSPLATFTSWS